MGTVVVCLYGGALWFVGVCVEGVQMGAYAFDWNEVLHMVNDVHVRGIRSFYLSHSGACLKCTVVCALWLTRRLVAHGNCVHFLAGILTVLYPTVSYK